MEQRDSYWTPHTLCDKKKWEKKLRQVVKHSQQIMYLQLAGLARFNK